ncbi:dimethylmenaquinone methyltransferase [Pseudolabrys sp. Root1462]|uniref:RraA family protein n=1 Tax=Pseudolabrys sp. Root1462 TaxID=1736466 RepID=UPI000703691E|nr:RraA family protein [Pseudolabrys sp. Root1462]KQY97282.1 dimethylmenaquinone methyltransferase [Pseudolabrys sp. Root1462]
MLGIDDLARAKDKLYTPVLSDVLDSFGHTSQAMGPTIRPLDDTQVLVGRVRTGAYMAVCDAGPEGENPYELEIQLIDDIKRGEIPVLGCAGNLNIAPWGELLTTATRMRGGVGCITDGLCRDVRFIRNLKFPVFCGGIGPLDSRGRGKMQEIDRPMECGGVKVRSGDIVFGDVDGVVVVPREIEDKVFEAAFKKVEGETRSRDELLKGRLLADVYAKYGIL